MSGPHDDQPPYGTDRLYLDLLGARERLCRAQTFVPRHWKSDLQVALDHVDQAGSALCPQQWSRFNQPEYPGDDPCLAPTTNSPTGPSTTRAGSPSMMALC